MTLIESMMTECVKRVKTSQSDGMLGHLNSWANSGAAFQAAIIKQANQQAKAYAHDTAEKPDLDEVYLVVVPTGTALAFYDVIKRASDGAVFRITGDLRDTQAPEQSSVQIAKTTAERWREE